MKASGLLARAAKKLTKKRWIKGHSALSKKGEMVSTRSPAAAFFCATGALSSLADVTKHGIDHYIEAGQFLDNAVRGKYKGDIVGFNDAKGRTWEQVQGTYKRAIATAKKAGK